MAYNNKPTTDLLETKVETDTTLSPPPAQQEVVMHKKRVISQ